VSRLPSPLRGIFPPLVTPLKDRDTLDNPGVERVVQHVLAGGVHRLFLLGTTGEGTSLSHRLRRELIEPRFSGLVPRPAPKISSPWPGLFSRLPRA
jgi:hypothetical protein